MDNSEAKIQCSNPNCLASNSHNNKICFRCGTPIVKRYLRLIGEGTQVYQRGELLAERYLLKQPHIVLDTTPGLSPQIPDEIPDSIIDYLQLYPYRLHIPQPYGQLIDKNRETASNMWLLEYGSLPLDERGELQYPQLLPELREVWQQATALRQLNWLWQVAKLWQPLQAKGLASTLLNLSLVRVNTSIVQLLDLEGNRNGLPSLSQLGQCWAQLIVNAAAEIKEFLQELCFRLENGEIALKEQLIALLERAIEIHRRFHQFHYQIYTSTDSGPSRKHNEDACYPDGDKLISIVPPQKPLTIVCDGIGGHEGGEIASGIAIETLKASVASIDFDKEYHNPIATQRKLATFTNAANDVISQRNDSEQRHERQRMGTTLVMALANYHEMYLTHVGDSRIYLVTSAGCHQLTIDDDLASREVRMGYALYRDAVQFPSAGALVQALGMRESQNLHPNVQRFIWDEDCVFLLCSDGLSDFDRVEQFWRSAILPVLARQSDLARVGKDLIRIANEKNGHDNVTVGLIYCQIKYPSARQIKPLSWREVEAAAIDYMTWSEENEIKPTSPTLKISEQPRSRIDEPTTEIFQPSEGLFPTPDGLFPSHEQVAREQNKRQRGRIFIGILAALICLALGATLYLVWKYKQNPQQIEQELPEQELPDPQPNNQQESPATTLDPPQDTQQEPPAITPDPQPNNQQEPPATTPDLQPNNQSPPVTPEAKLEF
jgi:protein phosphatase